MSKSFVTGLIIALALVLMVGGISMAVDKTKPGEKAEKSTLMPNSSVGSAEQAATETASEQLLKARIEEATRAYNRMLSGDLRYGDKALIEEFFPTPQSTSDRETSSLDENGGVWFNWTGNLAIPDNGCPTLMSAPITVGGLGAVLDIEVKIVNLTHTYDWDLNIYLTGPNGVERPLCLRRGSNGDNFVNTVFDDEATTTIAAGTAPFTGSYRPDSTLSIFDGIVANGTWTLKICDGSGQDTGTLTAWSIQILASSGTEAHDYTTGAVSSPVAGQRYEPSSTVPVTAIFTNFGTTTEASAVGYQFNGGATITENTAALVQYASETHTFASSISLPAADGTYQLKVWAAVPNDADHSNDTTFVNVWVMSCARPVPWMEGFETPTAPPALPVCWSQENVDGETATWGTMVGGTSYPPHGGLNVAKVNWSSSLPADDWLITPGFLLTGGVSYSFEYLYRCYLSSTSYTEWLEVYMGTEQTAAGMTTMLAPAFSFSEVTEWTSHAMSFTPASTGLYYIGIHYLTSINQGGILVDDLVLAEGEFTGRCCYGISTEPSCAEESSALCFARTNYISWTNGLTCATPCPSTPVNDICENLTDCTVLVAGTPVVLNGNNTNAQDNDCLGEPIVWECFETTSCMNVQLAYCGSEGTPDGYVNIFGDCECELAFPATPPYDNTSCGDGNYTVNYIDLPAGTWYIGIHPSLGPNYTVTLTPTACPVGRCCYDGGASCVDNISRPDCIAQDENGLWTEGLTCATECPPLPPCPISFSDCDSPDEYISNVNFDDGAINNTTIQDCPNHYGNFAHITAPAQPGQQYQLDISVVNVGSAWTQYVTCWIDWNLNDTWDIETERIEVGTFACPAGTPYVFSTTISVPADAPRGMPYMRVITQESAYSADGCDVASYGEAEDYRLVVGPVGAIAGAVRELGTNIAIPGADITVLEDPDAIAFSDADGLYTLGVDPGTYTVTCHKQGYCDITNTGVVVEDGNTTTRHFSMLQPAGAVNVTSINMATVPNINTTEQFIITNPGAGCPFEFTATSGALWLTIDPFNGEVAPNGSQTVTVTADVSGMAVGQYQVTVLIDHNDHNSPMEIPVVLDINPHAADDPHSIPTEFAFFQNYPNPFNATTALSFDVPVEANVEIAIFNVMGQEVARPVNGNFPAGHHKIMYTADGLPSGMYLVKMSAGEFSGLQKMVLLK